MAVTIFEFIWTLAWLDIDEAVMPSSTGLTILYYTHRYGDTRPEQTITRFFERGIGITLLSLFTGLTGANQTYPRSLSASCENGICAHQSTPKSLEASPEQLLRLHIVHGQIQCNGQIYSQIHDSQQLQRSFSNHPPSSMISSLGIEPSMELL